MPPLWLCCRSSGAGGTSPPRWTRSAPCSSSLPTGFPGRCAATPVPCTTCATPCPGAGPPHIARPPARAARGVSDDLRFDQPRPDLDAGMRVARPSITRYPSEPVTHALDEQVHRCAGLRRGGLHHHRPAVEIDVGVCGDRVLPRRITVPHHPHMHPQHRSDVYQHLGHPLPRVVGEIRCDLTAHLDDDFRRDPFLDSVHARILAVSMPRGQGPPTPSRGDQRP
ncbi:MAG: hypothetical protein QOF00_5588 [Pseudonocardiales bacterium]|jgi:hypothetical protein|nr:hypothetical protein [Pseudonocardiales bacterium]